MKIASPTVLSVDDANSLNEAIDLTSAQVAADLPSLLQSGDLAKLDTSLAELALA